MKKQRLYIGGYGDELLRLDWAEGRATSPVRFDVPTNPSYGVFDAAGARLYLVSERDAQGGAVAECAVDAEGNVALRGTWETSGGAPCHVCLSPTGRWLAAANYAGGSVDLFRVGANGGLRWRCCIRHEGKGLDPVRQEAPHAHFVRFLEDDLLCVIDLGLDALRLYRVSDAAAQADVAVLEGELRLAPGSGPRHLTVCPETGLLYVVCELQPELYTLRREGATLRVLHRLSLRPEGWSEPVYLSGVRVSFAKRRVYAALRGPDLLASVSLSPEGMPEAVRYTGCGGQTPREIELVPDGCYLLCANQGSDCVTVFALEPNGDVGRALQSVSALAPAWATVR